MNAVILSLLLGSSLPARLPPVEQCSGDPAFDRFRARLEQAVRDRDSHYRLVAKLVDGRWMITAFYAGD